ncbi:MAG: VOC family protein [Pseudomonadota bacterium]
MAHGDFIWADLSSYRPEVTRPFYTQLFEWKFDDYAAHVGKTPTAGLFQMPQKFMDMGMPSFWMSYIAVDDVAKAVETADKLGGKVELGSAEFEGGGQYALIRDPLGAGFTVYNGTALAGAAKGTNARLGHTLIVSDANAVMPFYTALFGWEFEAAGHDTFAMQQRGDTIGYLHQIEDPAIRGKEQYWAVLFGVANPDMTGSILNTIGGEVVADIDLPEGPTVVARDPDGAVFFLTQKSGLAGGSMPWKAYLGLAMMLAGLWFGDAVIWAVFLAVWIIMALRDKETWMFETVYQSQRPFLFWSILGLYAVFIAYTMAEVFGAV